MLRPNTNDGYIWDHVFQRNEYELTAELVKDRSVIDIGAHMGAFTMLSLSKGCQDVVAVEPLPDNNRVFLENVKKRYPNQFSHVTLIKKALWYDSQSFISLTDPPTREDGKWRPSNCYSTPSQEGIPSISIEDILELRKFKKYVLKIDCEGAEASMLNKLNLLKDCHYLIMEYHFGYPTYNLLLQEVPNIASTIPELEEALKRHFSSVKRIPETKSRGVCLCKNT